MNVAPDKMVSADLAIQINALHVSAVAKARGAIEDARRAGEMLLEVKAGLPHGAFGAWLADNIDFTDRTAQRYMLVAQNWLVIGSKSDTVSDLTVAGALRAIPRKSSPKPDVQEVVVDPEQRHLEADVARAAQIQVLACLLDAWEEADAATRARFLETPDVHDGLMECVRTASKGWR